MVGTVDHDLGDVGRSSPLEGFDQRLLVIAGWHDLVATAGDQEQRLL